MSMTYDIAAIPTRYAGVKFRSRLEARWASFFDLCKWRWDYEPLDLHGWTPDFVINTPYCNVFAEVKPVDQPDPRDPVFQKAVAHQSRVQVMLLGIGPQRECFGGIGILLDPPKGAQCFWPVQEYLCPDDLDEKWREAGNIVQWRGGR
jgi:hypothetical protein